MHDTIDTIMPFAPVSTVSMSTSRDTIELWYDYCYNNNCGLILHMLIRIFSEKHSSLLLFIII